MVEGHVSHQTQLGDGQPMKSVAGAPLRNACDSLPKGKATYPGLSELRLEY